MASRAARNGARLIGTNDDATYPTPDGPIPGGGAILASIVTAAGVVPIVAGKPHEPMADLVRATIGDAGSETRGDGGRSAGDRRSDGRDAALSIRTRRIWHHAAGQHRACRGPTSSPPTSLLWRRS